jgi:hypothetical protein
VTSGIEATISFFVCPKNELCVPKMNLEIFLPSEAEIKILGLNDA